MTDSAVAGLRRGGGSCRVIAHRGYSAAYRENTLEACEQAIRAGADLVEIDLRVSKDGLLVCQHDPAVGGMPVAEMTAGALLAIGVAWLDDVLPALRGRSALLFDLKRADTELAAEALAALRRYSMTADVVIGARSVEQARYVRAASPDSVILGFLKDPADFPDFYAAGGDIARLWEENCTPAAIAAARCGDRPVWVTAGRKSAADKPGDIDEPRLRGLLGFGIDGILVNDPVRALQVRGETMHEGVGR
jgi:glycerophosphoryl diester phosphodiesterase